MSNSSWDIEHSKKRRDFRNSSDGPDVNVKNKKKNTKKWCGGKEGRQHQIEIILSDRYGTKVKCGNKMFRPMWLCYHQEKCNVCGKILKYSLDKKCPKFENNKIDRYL